MQEIIDGFLNGETIGSLSKRFSIQRRSVRRILTGQRRPDLVRPNVDAAW